MEWEIVLPRFRLLLELGGVLAIVEQRQASQPWDAALSEVLTRYSLNRFYQPYDLVAELEQRGLFRPLGRVETEPVTFRQSVANYVESFHARNGFSRDRMTREAAAAFDAEAERVILPFTTKGFVSLEITGLIVWGTPAPRAGPAGDLPFAR
jgi:hypothetical protein